MIISAAILSKEGRLFYSNELPYELESDIRKHAESFLNCLSEEEDVEITYIEREHVRYIYKETGDLYWLLVTKPDSDLFIDIKILGRFVCTIMEYGLAPETNSETITSEQRDLFYRHVWRPWDDGDECPLCNSSRSSDKLWAIEFEARLQFFISIRDGNVDDSDAEYFNGLMYEAWSASIKLNPKWSRLNRSSSDSSFIDSDEDAQSICEEALLDGCRLKCFLSRVRLEASTLQDPYMRPFAVRDLLIGSTYKSTAQQTSAPTRREIDSQSSSCDNLSE